VIQGGGGGKGKKEDPGDPFFHSLDGEEGSPRWEYLTVLALTLPWWGERGEPSLGVLNRTIVDTPFVES
jgi:hypothetical protein